MIEIPNAAAAVCAFEIVPYAVGQNIWQSSTAIIAAINDELAGDGLTIAQNNLGFSAYSAALTGDLNGTVTILNQSGQELDDTDLQAQFTDACAQVNMTVVSFAVQQVVGGSTGTNSGTGAAGNVVTTGAGNIAAMDAAKNPPSAVHACGDPSWSGFSDPLQYIKCMTQSGLTSVGLLAIGLLVGVVLLVFAQKKTHGSLI